MHAEPAIAHVNRTWLFPQKNAASNSTDKKGSPVLYIFIFDSRCIAPVLDLDNDWWHSRSCVISI